MSALISAYVFSSKLLVVKYFKSASLYTRYGFSFVPSPLKWISLISLDSNEPELEEIINQ